MKPESEKRGSCCGSSPESHKEDACHSADTRATEQAATADSKVTSGCCGESATPSVSMSCCGTEPSAEEAGCCSPSERQRIDWLLWGSLPVVVLGYLGFLLMGHDVDQALDHTAEHAADHANGMALAGWLSEWLPEWLAESSWLMTWFHTSHEMVNAMWWGILSAALFVGLLGRIPREAIMSVLGQGGTKTGLVRATLAGLLLDLCNHGILMVAMKLYERGASLGQVMAFLIASPWNSLTLTLILVGLIGLPWTLLFIAGSLVIAWVSGWVFDRLVAAGHLPANPYKTEVEAGALMPALRASWQAHEWGPRALLALFWQGLKESRMVLRWVVFGVVLVVLIRIFVPPESFGVWFGATLSGLMFTLLATTVMEVCSEGSSPIAADLFNRAGAPGNAFTFLMAGAATDYTEIMALKETTKSWKIALFLPLVTVPQVILVGWIMNQGLF